MTEPPLRVVLVDADDVARELRDAGFEVVFLRSADPSAVARVAVQEDADAVIAGEDALDAVRERLAALDAADIPALTLPQGRVGVAEAVRTSVRRSR